MRRHPRSTALPALALALVACAPVSFVSGRPEVSVRAEQGPLRATLRAAAWAPAGATLSVDLQPREAHVVRAALVPPRSDVGRCDPTLEACDELDPRFTAGVTAVVSHGGSYVFTFPTFGATRVLAREPRLLLDVELAGEHRLLELDLARVRAMRPSPWGLAAAARVRAPGLATAHFGGELSGALSVERWFASTRLQLAYEVGVADCAGTAQERARCQDDDLVVPFRFGLDAAQFVRLGPAATLGIGLGYEGVAVLGRFRSQSDHQLRADPFLHGPRLSLTFARTPPRVPRFALQAPRNAAAPELSLELLGKGAFSEPTFIVGLGWAYWLAF